MAHSTTWLEASQRVWESQKIMYAKIKKSPFIPHPHPTISPLLIPLYPLHLS